MTGRTHLLVGIAVGAMIAQVLQAPPNIIIFSAFAGALGGLLPDIDHPQSIISGYTPGSGVLRLAISHRGPTHTLLFALAFSLLWLLSPLPDAAGYAFASGIALHLLCDMATPAGVRLLWPVSRQSFRIAPRWFLWNTSWILEFATSWTAVLLIGLVVRAMIE